MKRLLFFLVILLASTHGVAAPNQISDARLTEQRSGSQLVFDLRRSTPYQYFHLDNPPRLVLDIPDAQLARPINNRRLRSADVVKVRTGMRDNNRVLRVVMELRDRINYKITQLRDSGYRLVVDFYRPQRLSPDQNVASTTTAAPKPIKPKLVARPAGNDAKPRSPQQLAPIKLASTAAAAPKVRTTQAPAPAAAAAAAPKTPLVIAIDPGHGGKDPGAIGASGTHEKAIVMEISKRLKALVDKQPGMRACLTRSKDQYLGLSKRLKIAREHCNADLFLSIHADAYQKSTSGGASVFVLSTKGASSAMARHLAKRENRSGSPDGRFDAGDEALTRVVLDMVQSAVLGESRALAQQVLKQLGKIGKLHGDKKVEYAGFAVLKAYDIPSILVETAFISNPEEERKLRSKPYQIKLARALLEGILSYLKQRPQLFPQSSTLAVR